MIGNAKYTKPLGTFSLSEWKLCHIEPVGFNSNKAIEELSTNDIKEHFKKYAILPICLSFQRRQEIWERFKSLLMSREGEVNNFSAYLTLPVFSSLSRKL